MTFRPSDDVLDEITDGQQSSLSEGQYNVGNQDNGEVFFNNHENLNNNLVNENYAVNTAITDIPVEEVKAPDLSELLKNSDSFSEPVGGIKNESDALNGVENQGINNSSESKNNVENSNIVEETKMDVAETKMDVVETKKDEMLVEETEAIETKNDLNYVDSGKINDVERSALVSGIEGSLNSNLDFLVDNDRISIIRKYEKINRLFLRWGAFFLATIVGILSGIFLQIKASHLGNVQMINDLSIDNKNKWVESTSDKILAPLVDSGIDIKVFVPYGTASMDSDSFQTKSNLVSYKGIILPQLFSLDYNDEDIISLEDFNSQKITRDDIKNLINSLIINDSIYNKTTNLSNVLDSRWVGNEFDGSLEDGFNLGCLSSNKVSDFVCDKFLEAFYNYGKYYNLSKYSSEVKNLVRILRIKKKKIKPVCNMINEYTLRAGVLSEDLKSVMEYCDESDNILYKKMINFIDLENSLTQPELSDKVFDDPDLNAYKLLSAQQSVYKILDGTSLNENYVRSYLNFLQALINKDGGNGRYLLPIYKDLAYVFNMDELYQKLMQKGKLSSDLKLKIDQINNGNSMYGFSSLLSQLTTVGLVQVNTDYTGMVVDEKSIEDLFSQYYAMTDRLRIRKSTKISDDELKVQTEMFTEKITNATDGETLKLTIELRKKNNLLYVDSIKVANQPKFSDILGIYASEENVTFYAMLNYIDEQVGMWYELTPEDLEDQPTFCEEIMEREDISVYTCDDTSISLYKGDVEYNFTLENGILDSFTISDENLEKIIKDKLDGVMFMRDSTPSMITSIIDFSIESEDDNLEKKLEIIDQFRIHFKLVPDDIHDIEGDSNQFLVDFTLGDFSLQGRYDIETHSLFKIYYMNCEKPLEIRQMTLEIVSENEPQLIEILNNPKVYFAKINPAAYKKYQKVCGGNSYKVTK